MPIIPNDTAEKYPDLVSLIESLGDKLTEPVMIELNYKVDELHRDPRKVALEFLQEAGLLHKTAN